MHAASYDRVVIFDKKITLPKKFPPPIFFCFCLPSYHPREFIKDLVHMHAASYDRVVLVLTILLSSLMDS